jgi:hypothetical protein
MARIAFLTFGNMVAPYGDPAVEVFESAIEATYDQVDASPGFICHMADAEWIPGGDRLRSPFYTGGRSPELDAEATTLSIWADLESVYAFAYSGSHLDAFKRRRESFESGDWPSHVAWWIGDDELPTWEDAFARQQLIHGKGPSPEAFNFRKPYAPDGTATKLRRQG